jgi:hypothetical protein
MVIAQLLEDICGLTEKEVYVVLDPEILLLFSKIAHMFPERMKNLVLLPAIFHLRKHNIENIANDPVHLLLFFLVFSHDCLGLQEDKKEEMADKIFAQMQSLIRKKQFELDPDNAGKIFSDATQTAARKKKSTCKYYERILSDQEAIDALEVQVDDDDYIHVDGDCEEEIPERMAMGNGTNLFTQTKLEIIVKTIYEYIGLGLRVDDLSYQELMSRKINYGRQFFIFQQLHYVFQKKIKDICQRIFEPQASWAASLVFDMLDKGVGDLCMIPFQKIILEGNAHTFLRSFPVMTKLMAHYKRDKVARSQLILRSIIFQMLGQTSLGYLRHSLEELLLV